MTQKYIGTKQITAWPAEKDGKPGYGVKYEDGYTSWSPKEAFEKAYLPMGLLTEPVKDDGGKIVDLIYRGENANKITQEMVDGFVSEWRDERMGEKTTVVQAILKNGFVITDSSSCVDPANYNHEIGFQICQGRIKNQIWNLLGFTLQWARTGLTPAPV